MRAGQLTVNRLITEYDPVASRALGADHWRVCTAIKYSIRGAEAHVYVPAGFLTDGASVPRVLWALIPPWGLYGLAAVIHDHLCEYLSVTIDGRPVAVSRAYADRILGEVMADLGVPALTRGVINAGVAIYRRWKRIDAPSNTPIKRRLESQWRATMSGI